MKMNRFALPALAFALGTSAFMLAQNKLFSGPTPQDQDHQHADHDRGGWDAPPQEFRDIQRQGFRDGLEAGHRDFESGHPPNVEIRREFRHPPVPPQARDEYREGFRHGYESASRHYREDRDHHGDDRDRQ